MSWRGEKELFQGLPDGSAEFCSHYEPPIFGSSVAAPRAARSLHLFERMLQVLELEKTASFKYNAQQSDRYKSGVK